MAAATSSDEVFFFSGDESVNLEMFQLIRPRMFKNE